MTTAAFFGEPHRASSGLGRPPNKNGGDSPVGDSPPRLYSGRTSGQIGGSVALHGFSFGALPTLVLVRYLRDCLFLPAARLWCSQGGGKRVSQVAGLCVLPVPSRDIESLLARSHERAQPLASPRWRLVEKPTTLRARPSTSAPMWLSHKVRAAWIWAAYRERLYMPATPARCPE